MPVSHRRRRARGLAALAGALTVAAVGCGGGDTAGGPPGHGGSVTIGVSGNEPGLGLQAGSSFSGFETDIARYLARDLGYTKVRFRPVTAAQRAEVLQSHRAKMVLDAYPMTTGGPVSFAGPYFVAGQDLLVRAGDTGLTGPLSLNGRTLCSTGGSAAAANVQRNYSSSVRLKPYPSLTDCAAALSSGAVDAVTSDDLVLAGLAAQPAYAGQLRVVGRPFTTVRYGVGLAAGDPDLCRRVTAALTKMESDGSWQRALDAAVGASGYVADPRKNPPPPDACPPS